MRLLHYSATPLTAVHDTRQEQNRYDKPDGFWVSVDDAWEEWCRGECFDTDRLRHVTEVVLAQDAKILWVETESALRKLSTRYPSSPDRTYRFLSAGVRRSAPDWSSIAKDYDGIVITPYFWKCRYDVSWYYGWDVASGCIWNASAIAQLTPLVDLQLRTAYTWLQWSHERDDESDRRHPPPAHRGRRDP